MKKIFEQNTLNWFEIPTSDLARAIAFYGHVFGCELKQEKMGETEMAVFPYAFKEGIGGALVHHPAMKPGAQGTVVYLNAGEDLAPVLERIAAAGGQVVMPRTVLPQDIGSIALFKDCEGNVVGLHSFT